MSKHIKVLMLSRELAWGGGVVNYVDTLSNHLSDDIDVENFRIGRQPGSSSLLARLSTTLADTRRLIDRLRHNDVDVVHINPSLDKNSLLRDGLFLLSLRLIGAKHSLAFIHGWNQADANRIRENRLLRYLFNQTFGSAAQIVVLASDFKRQLEDLGCNGDKIAVSTTMYDHKLLEGIKQTKKTRSKRILFMGRFVAEKGIFELLDAFKIVNNSLDDCQLILAGDGPVRAEVEQWVKDNNMATQITITGYVRQAEKAHLLAQADLFVLPTYHGEGCPVAILEAMAAGLAVISTPVGGIPDILCGDSDRVLLKDTTPETISTAILRLLQDQVGRSSIGNDNQKKANLNYSAPVVAKKMGAIYAQLAH